MKPMLLVLAAAGLAHSATALEKAMLEPFPEARYQPMIARSPFALATPVAPPVAADKSFADGWYLAGISQFDGKNFVAVRSRDLSVQFSLYGDERREDNGVKLQSVEWSPTLGRTTATIEKDGQFAKLEQLNQSELASAAPAPMPAVSPGNPSARQLPSSAGRPQGATAPQPLAVPRPLNVIPRPSTAPAAPGQPNYQITPGIPANPAAQPANAPAAPAGEGRRRIRMINSAPATTY